MHGFFHVSFYRTPPGCRNANVPHTHAHHELLFATAGEGGQLAEHREFALRAGDLFFFPAGTRHCSIFQAGKYFDCFVLCFEDHLFTPAIAGDKEVLDVVDKMGRLRGKIPLSTESQEMLRPLFDDLLAEFQRKQPAYHAVLKMLAMRLLVSIARDEEFRREGLRICPSPSNESMIREVTDYLEAFYMNDVTVDSVLEFCPLSRSHFHAVFKKTTGKSLIQYLTEIRLENAKKLLAGTDEPIAEVAARTGMKNSSYFGQLFRAATGFSPSQYRKKPLTPRGQAHFSAIKTRARRDAKRAEK